MWKIKHIFDGEYGCEETYSENEKTGAEADADESPMLLVTLEDESGNERYERVSDAWLTKNNLDMGSEWPETPSTLENGIEPEIKNLILDIGGVLVGYRVDDMLRDHKCTDEEISEFHKCVLDDPMWAEFDIENYSFEEVVDMYCEKYPHIENVIREFMSHTEEMSTARPEIWERVQQLKNMGYKIYLLSNYGSVFFQTQIEHLPFMKLIDGRVVSYEIHQIKPYDEIYKYLLSHYGLNGRECLFLDDKLENVEAARKNGMQSEQVRSREQLAEMLDQIIGSC